jgi:hypothetical protein
MNDGKKEGKIIGNFNTRYIIIIQQPRKVIIAVTNTFLHYSNVKYYSFDDPWLSIIFVGELMDELKQLYNLVYDDNIKGYGEIYLLRRRE